jgi:hypothetical protein
VIGARKPLFHGKVVSREGMKIKVLPKLIMIITLLLLLVVVIVPPPSIIIIIIIYRIFTYASNTNLAQLELDIRTIYA